MMTEELIQTIYSVTTNEDCYETIPEDFVREVDYSPDMVKGVVDVIRDQTAARTRKMARPSTVPSTLGGKETREKDSQRNKVDEPQITLSGDKTPGTQTDTKVRESEPVVHQWGDSRDIDTANSSRTMDIARDPGAAPERIARATEKNTLDPGAAPEQIARATDKNTLDSQTTHNDAPTKERVMTEVTPPMRDPITSSRPKRANAGKRITVFLPQNKADEY